MNITCLACIRLIICGYIDSINKLIRNRYTRFSFPSVLVLLTVMTLCPVFIKQSHGLPQKISPNTGLTEGQQPNLDSLFLQARTYAFEFDNRTAAIELVKQILSHSPAHYDARVFLGRLNAWEGDYESAILNLKTVLDELPNYEDARSALVDTYIWNNQHEIAISTLKSGLFLNPSNIQFQYKLAICLHKIGQPDEAQRYLQSVLELDPTHQDAKSLIEKIQGATIARRLGVGIKHDRLADTQTKWQMLVGEASMDPWQIVVLEYEQKLRPGPLIVKYTYANRFAQRGSQIELESYPALRKGMYAYLGLGISRSALFPRYRVGLEVFQAIPRAFEVSVGIRYLHLSFTDVAVITTSLGKYLGKQWVSVRGYITPQDVSYSRSWSFQARRYLAKEKSYIELAVGSGESPDLAQGSDEVSYLSSRRFQVMAQFNLNESSIIQLGMNVANFEIREAAYRGDTGFSFKYSWSF